MPRLIIIDPSVYSNPKSSFKEALGEIMPSRHDVRLRIGQPFQLKPLPEQEQRPQHVLMHSSENIAIRYVLYPFFA